MYKAKGATEDDLNPRSDAQAQGSNEDPNDVGVNNQGVNSEGVNKEECENVEDQVMEISSESDGECSEQVEDELKFNENRLVEINSQETRSDLQVPKPLITIPLPQATVPQVHVTENNDTFGLNSDSAIGTIQRTKVHEALSALNKGVNEEMKFFHDKTENKLINIGKLWEHLNAMTHHVVECDPATALARENRETLRVMHRNSGHSVDCGPVQDKQSRGVMDRQSGVMDMATECVGCGVTFVWDSLSTVKMEGS